MAEQSFWTEVAPWLWTQRDQIVKTLKELSSWFRGNQKGNDGRGIVILGAGGTGKTTLATMLAGEYEPLIDAVEPYSESIGIEEYSLSDDPTVEIVVPPGQSHRRESTWDGLLMSLARGDYRGVILASAFGYHSLGEISPAYVTTTTTADPNARDITNETHPLGQIQDETDRFVAAYILRQQEEEIRILERVLDHIGRSGKRTWLLSLITKRDLWWPQEAAVEYHYREGRYRELLATFEMSVNRQLFRHEIVFLSLTISRFVTSRSELLTNNAAGYDHPLHYQSQRRLFETVKALRDWEAGT